MYWYIILISNIQWNADVKYLLFPQGDVLRNNLLARYFGKGFIQKPENVDIGVSRSTTITHGPGGKKMS